MNLFDKCFSITSYLVPAIEVNIHDEIVKNYNFYTNMHCRDKLYTKKDDKAYEVITDRKDDLILRYINPEIESAHVTHCKEKAIKPFIPKKIKEIENGALFTLKVKEGLSLEDDSPDMHKMFFSFNGTYYMVLTQVPNQVCIQIVESETCLCILKNLEIGNEKNWEIEEILPYIAYMS